MKIIIKLFVFLGTFCTIIQILIKLINYKIKNFFYIYRYALEFID